MKVKANKDGGTTVGFSNEPYMGWCDVEGCENEAANNGGCWRESGYWLICSKHSAQHREGKPQPQMKQSAIDREKSRDAKGYLPSPKANIMQQVCKEHEWVDFPSVCCNCGAYKTTGLKVEENLSMTIVDNMNKAHELIECDNCDGRGWYGNNIDCMSCAGSGLILKSKYPIDFKIEENLKVIEDNKWEDIWNEWLKTDEYRTTTIFYHWLQKNYFAPEKK